MKIDHWWRVFAWLPDADEDEPGHPAYVHSRGQGAGRFDNPNWYTAGYMAATPACAAGEVFGHHPVWREDMLYPGNLPGSVRTLVEIRAPGLQLVDLDDPNILIQYGLKPSEVVRRNRDRTRELGLRLFLERQHDGVQWWSYYRPEWTVATLWRGHETITSPPSAQPLSPFLRFELGEVDPLTLDHPALLGAADALNKTVES